MKEIQEIRTKIENISKEQVATDLSKEEKEELLGLINASNISTTQSNGCLPFCATPSPTVLPTCSPDNACSSESFCCVVAFSSDLDVDPNEIHAAVVPKDLSIEPNGQCTTKVGNCTITLNKGIVTGCAEVFVSLGVKDKCGNCSFVCCSDFVCLFQNDIVCCELPNPENIKFVVSDLSATELGFGCEGQQQVWQLSGNFSFNCGECV